MLFRVAMVFACLALIGPSLAAGKAQPVPRGETGTPMVIPPGSPLRLASVDRETLEVTFAGRFQISGTYFYGGGEAAAYLVPDRQSRAILPYFKDRGAPDSIYFDNGEAFAKAAIPAEALARMRTDGADHVSGRITVWADRFKAGIECDTPWYSARFLSVVKPPVRLAANEPEGGC